MRGARAGRCDPSRLLQGDAHRLDDGRGDVVGLTSARRLGLMAARSVSRGTGAFDVVRAQAQPATTPRPLDRRRARARRNPTARRARRRRTPGPLGVTRRRGRARGTGAPAPQPRRSWMLHVEHARAGVNRGALGGPHDLPTPGGQRELRAGSSTSTGGRPSMAGRSTTARVYRRRRPGDRLATPPLTRRTRTTVVGARPAPTSAARTSAGAPPSREISRAADGTSSAAREPFSARSAPPGSTRGRHQRTRRSSGATARAVTVPAASDPCSSSARPRRTSTEVRPSVVATSRSHATRRSIGSTSTTRWSGRRHARTTPGRPAPLPTSITVPVVGTKAASAAEFKR